MDADRVLEIRNSLQKKGNLRMKLNTIYSLKFGIILTLFLVLLVGCNKEIEPVALLPKQEEQEKKLQEETEEKGNSSELISILNNLIDSGFKLWDKADSVSSSIGNTLSMLDSDVRKVRKQKFIEDGTTFTLEDLFNSTLDNPKWKSKEIDGVNLVMITGGGSKFLKSLDSKELDLERSLEQSIAKSIELTVILPVHKGMIVTESMGSYFEVQGVKTMPVTGPGVLSELMKIYLSEHAKK
jgi:hypothetical protein